MSRSGPVGYCPPCDKLQFLCRKDARARARRAFPGDHLSAYRCDGFWHFGNLNPAVIRGERTRDGVPAEPCARPRSPHLVAAAVMRSIWEATRQHSSAA